MKLFNKSRYWTWKNLFAVLGIILLLAIIKVFTGPPPPGKSSWLEVFSDHSQNGESKDLPRLIKKHPGESKIVEREVRDVFSSMDEKNIKLVEGLTQKAITLLPENDRQQLMSLHVRLNKGGYDALTVDEINIMQRLNEKAINLLPYEDRAKLNEIWEKSTAVVLKSRLKTLVNNLDHPDEAVRWQAIVELEKFGSEAKLVMPDIIPYLKSDDWRVRYYAVEILGMIGPDARVAIPDLRKLLNDSDEKVRSRTSWALEEISKENQ